MTKTRKRVTMLVTISIPAGYSVADARREVRSLVAEQCNYSMDDAELKLISVRPAKSKE